MLDDEAYRAEVTRIIAEDPHLTDLEKKLSEDAFLASEVERQCSYLRNLLPAAAYVSMRAVTIETFTGHPIMNEQLRAARPRGAPIKSDELPVDGAVPTDRKARKPA